MSEPAVTTPNVLKGPWPERQLFINRLEAMATEQGISMLLVRKQLSARIGDSEDGSTVYRLINGDTRSRVMGYSLQPSPRIARALALAMGLEEMALVSTVPPDLHKKVKATEPAIPAQPPLLKEEPKGVDPKTLMMPPDEDVPPTVVRTAYHYLPLDRCGQWGISLMQTATSWWKNMLAGNKVPSLVRFLDDDKCIVTVLGLGATSNPMLAGLLPLENNHEVDAVMVAEHIAALFLLHGAAYFQEGEKAATKRATAKGAVQDPLMQTRAHVQDLTLITEAMGAHQLRIDDLDYAIGERIEDPADPLRTCATQLLLTARDLRRKVKSLIDKIV